jgi:hypothetical protein
MSYWGGGGFCFFFPEGSEQLLWRILLLPPMRRKPKHTAHLFLNLSFVPQILNNPAHQSRIHALSGQVSKTGG